jgi:tripartite-type tricarboxylate transporter receptor subunit TctC
MAPAKTPDAVVDRLAFETAKAIASPGRKERLHAMGSEAPAVRTPAQFTAFVERERKIYGELVKRSGASAD